MHAYRADLIQHLRQDNAYCLVESPVERKPNFLKLHASDEQD